MARDEPVNDPVRETKAFSGYARGRAPSYVCDSSADALSPQSTSSSADTHSASARLEAAIMRVLVRVRVAFSCV